MRHALEVWAAEHGGLAAWGPSSVLSVVDGELAGRIDAGEFDRRFLEDVGPFACPATSSRTRLPSVLVVALPRPAHAVLIRYKGRTIRGLLPPTYVRYRPSFEEVRVQLVARVFPDATLEVLDAPLKALAARLGLTRYGRNNIAYAPRIGSYMQLYGYATDAALPIGPDWRPAEPRLLDECEDCDVCQSTCPTAAIGGDRILLHGERCLTYANESTDELPGFIPPSAHHCLVGCLHCQRPCPANPPLTVEDTGVVLDEAGTALFVDPAGGSGAERDALRARLDNLGLSFDLDLLGRNLGALLRRHGAAAVARPEPVASRSAVTDNA